MNNFRKIIRTWCIFTFLLLVFNLAGCASANIDSLLNNPTSTNTPPDYNRWLHKQPCAPPCWEGITPGTTHYKDAVALLKQNQWFEKVDVHLPDEITWDWRGTIYRGQLKFDAWATSPVIQAIVISSPKKISFKDVVAELGNPDYVTVTADTGEHEDGIWYGMQLYYISSGVYLAFRPDPTDNDTINIKPTLSSSESLANYAIFFIPSFDGLSVAINKDKTILQDRLIPWQGTFDFDTYCKLQYPDELWRCG